MFIKSNNRFFSFLYYRRLLSYKRWNKVFKRHAESYFNFRRKTYLYYYKKGRKTVFWEKSVHKNQMSKTFKVSFKSQDKYYLIKTPLIAYIKLIKRFANSNKFKHAFRSRVVTFPDFSLTSKPKSIRMGKGKGEITKFIYFLKIGNIISEIRFKRNRLKLMQNTRLIRFKYNLIINKLIRKIKFKFPVKTHVCLKIW